MLREVGLLRRTFNSVRVNPRPVRTRALYLMVGHRTIGLSLSTGRGATAAAFARRAMRRDTFLPAYIFPPICQKSGISSQESSNGFIKTTHLVEVSPNSALPVLAEVYQCRLVRRCSTSGMEWRCCSGLSVEVVVWGHDLRLCGSCWLCLIAWIPELSGQQGRIFSPRHTAIIPQRKRSGITHHFEVV